MNAVLILALTPILKFELYIIKLEEFELIWCYDFRYLINELHMFGQNNGDSFVRYLLTIY